MVKIRADKTASSEQQRRERRAWQRQNRRSARDASNTGPNLFVDASTWYDVRRGPEQFSCPRTIFVAIDFAFG
jgi:hypothetical protein